jgi:hypothetical protein
VKSPSSRTNSNVKRYIAEFIGTFALVFAGTGAIVIDETSGGAVTHVGVALTFVSCICIVGDGETDGEGVWLKTSSADCE